jgi:hypothetical protein
MKKLPLYLLLLFVACKQEQKQLSVKPVAVQTPASKKFSPVDSLIKYDESSKEIRINIDSPSSFLFIANVNHIRTGILAITDSLIIVFKKPNSGNWTETGRFAFNNYMYDISLTDLNNDGYKDIRIASPIMRGNNENIVLLFHKSDSNFYHNPKFDLLNIGYDKRTGLIRSSCLGGIYDDSKELYKIQGDSLYFFKRVEFDMDGIGKTAEVIFFKNANGNKKRIKTIKGRSTKMWNLFEKTFWTDDMNYYDRTD